jgi:hypothetical protein
MNLINRKNELLFFALVALLFMFVMGYTLYNKRVNAPQLRYQKQVQDLEQQSSSDEVEAIEKDLLNTDFDSLDSELQEIEAELNLAI